MNKKGKSQKHICMLVHNAVSNDIRVMKEAKSLVASGYKVTVIGILPKNSHLPLNEEIDGIHIIRIKRFIDKKYEEFQNNKYLFSNLPFMSKSKITEININETIKFPSIIKVSNTNSLQMPTQKNNNISLESEANKENKIHIFPSNLPLINVIIIKRINRIFFKIQKRIFRILNKIQKRVIRVARKIQKRIIRSWNKVQKRIIRFRKKVQKLSTRFTNKLISRINKTIRWGIKKFLHLRNFHRSQSIPYIRTLYRLIFQTDIDMKDDAEIITALKAVDADAYHAHDYPALLQIIRAFPENNIKKIYDSHELFFDRQPWDSPKRELGRKYRLEKFQEKIYARKADHIITVSESIAKVMQEKWQVPKPIVILNAVDTRNPGIKEIDYLVEGKIIVHSGNITYGRNLSQLVKGLAHTPEDINLIFMGLARPYIISPLLDIAENLNIKHRIHVFSPVKHKNICKTLNQADAGVVLFSKDALNYRYGMPNKFFEYISAGIPILAGQADEMADFIRSENIGIVCDENDPISIGNGIIKVLENKTNNIFRDNLKRVSESINWEFEEEKLLTFYQGVFH